MKSLSQIHKLCVISLLITVLIFSSCRNKLDTMVTPEEMQMKNNWVKEHFKDFSSTTNLEESLAGTKEILTNEIPLKTPDFSKRTTQLPFSFIYNGKPSDDLLKSWQQKTETGRADISQKKRTMIWTDPETGLEVRCITIEYSDYPVVEWTVYLKNNGKKNTDILENIQGLDAIYIKESEGEFVLNGNKGDMCTANSFEPISQNLMPLTSKKFSPVGGRSTNGINGWPYYNLQVPGGGIMMAIGWPGQWASYFIRDSKNELRIIAGQELTHLFLKPGEEIRTPLIVNLFWKGTDVQRSQNIWRRWMIAHNLPRTADGRLPEINIVACSSHQFAEMTKANEENQKYFISRYLDEGMIIDYWWMDAGWYPCDSVWWKVGTWKPDSVRFPKGLKAVSDFAHSKNVKTIVWFEPERVHKGSWIEENHKEWLLSNPAGGNNFLFDFGNPDAWKWMTGHINNLIDEQGIDLYRQDFNMDPMSYWRTNDSSDRQGITENFYLQGLLAYWDELRMKHPGMRIDECASGGRRDDIEMMRRSTPFIRSDYMFEPTSQQCHLMGFTSWIPYNGAAYPGWGQNHKVEMYNFRSNMSAGMILTFDMRLKELNYKLAKHLYDQLRLIGHNYMGDFYPLTDYSLQNNVWMAWQYNLPETGEGLIQAFRRDSCDLITKTFRLYGLNPSAQFEVTNFDIQGSTKVSGKELMEKGVTIEIPDKPGAVVINYKKLK